MTISGAIGDGVNTYDFVALSAATGTVILSGNNTYGGSTVAGAGTLKLANGDNRIPVGSHLMVGFAGGGEGIFDLNGYNQTVGGLSLYDPVNTNSQVLNNGTSASTLTVNNSPNYTYAGKLDDGISSLAITKSGTGTFILSGTNTYSGNTAINAGTLKLGVANVVPDGAGKGNVSVTGTFDLNTYSETVNGLSGAGTVDNTAAGTPVLTVGNNNTTSAFSGAIQNTAGNLALAKIGNGTLTLSGTNTYTGTTTVSEGTLNVTGSITEVLHLLIQELCLPATES